MSDHKYRILQKEILARSQAKHWSDARREWSIDRIYWERNPETCLCSHHPINELCFLRNRLNGNEVLVGNVCVKKFIGLPSQALFDGIKRIADDKAKALNETAVNHAKSKGWITDWEHRFCIDTMRKRKLTDKQLQKRFQINVRVLARVRDARPD